MTPAALALAAGALPILSGHSHNDYERDAPLTAALATGLISVEVDVHLVGGELLVGHDEDDLDPDGTLESLYLEPLRRHSRAHDGRVFPAPHELLLLVDVKSEAAPAWQALRGLLARYPDLCGAAGPVEVVVSGNRARDAMLGDAERLATYDGRLSDLETETPPGFITLVSDDWEDHFAWRGRGPMPERDRAKLARVIAAAHERDWRVRFWKTPEPPGRAIEAVWSELLAAGVDLIGTDEPGRYAAFARARQR